MLSYIISIIQLIGADNSLTNVRIRRNLTATSSNPSRLHKFCQSLPTQYPVSRSSFFKSNGFGNQPRYNRSANSTPQ